METPRRRPTSNPASPAERPPTSRGGGGGGAETAPLPRAAGRSGEAQTRGGSPGRRTAGCRAGARDPPESGLCRRFEAHVNPGEDGPSLHPSPSLTAITRIRPQDVVPRVPALRLACHGRFPRSGRRSAGGAVGAGGSRTLTDGRSSGRRPHAAETQGWRGREAGAAWASPGAARAPCRC